MAKRRTVPLLTPDFYRGFVVGIIIAVLFWYFFSQMYGLSADTAPVNPNI